MRTKSGKKRCTSSIPRKVIEHSGKKFILGKSYDITDRKRAEDALIESEEFFRLITENISDLVCV